MEIKKKKKKLISVGLWKALFGHMSQAFKFRLDSKYFGCS